MAGTEPITNIVAAVPHATNPIAQGQPRAVICTVAGNLVCSFDGVNDVTVPLAVGQWFPIQPRYIRAASTATVLLGY